MDTLPALIVLGAMLVLVLTVAGGFLARRRALTGRTGSFECLVRGRGDTWLAGTAQYAAGCLMWWNAISLSPRPAHTWSRDELSLSRRSSLGQTDETGAELLLVDCTHRGHGFQLVMSAPAYAGLLSWLESRPSGTRR